MLADIGVIGQKFILVFFRVISILWLLPLFSARSVAAGYKAGTGLLIAFLLMDTAVMTGAPVSDPYLLLLLVMKEIFIGLTVGFVVRILFMTVYVAGELISLQAGFGFARFMDPYTNTQVSELSQLLNILTLMIFFAMDGHHIVIKGLAQSFKDLPLGGAALKGPLFEYLVEATGKVFSLGLKVGAPLVITLFLVEISMGILSRMIPQVQAFVEGMPLKIMITLAMFSFSLSILVPIIAGFFKGMETEIPRILKMMV